MLSQKKKDAAGWFLLLVGTLGIILGIVTLAFAMHKRAAGISLVVPGCFLSLIGLWGLFGDWQPRNILPGLVTVFRALLVIGGVIGILFGGPLIMEGYWRIGVPSIVGGLVFFIAGAPDPKLWKPLLLRLLHR